MIIRYTLCLIVCVTLAGHNKDVPFITGGPLLERRYLFEQMHFHWGPGDCGSEHEINGRKSVIK